MWYDVWVRDICNSLRAYGYSETADRVVAMYRSGSPALESIARTAIQGNLDLMTVADMIDGEEWG